MCKKCDREAGRHQGSLSIIIWFRSLWKLNAASVYLQLKLQISPSCGRSCQYKINQLQLLLLRKQFKSTHRKSWVQVQQMRDNPSMPSRFKVSIKKLWVYNIQEGEKEYIFASEHKIATFLMVRSRHTHFAFNGFLLLSYFSTFHFTTHVGLLE